MTEHGNPNRGQPASCVSLGRRLLALFLVAWATTAHAETPEEFAGRLKKSSDLDVSVNHREDGRLGSISVKFPPKVLANRDRSGPALDEVAKFAVASQLKADVIVPTKDDAAFVGERLRSAGVTIHQERVMAEGVSNKTARIFLVPAAPVK